MCSNDKEACISNVLCYQEGGNVRVWNLRFHRDFHERELEDAYSFLECIQPRIPRGGGSHTSHWCLKGNGKFDTRSYYNTIRGAAASIFPWKGVWKAKIPKRVAFFVWTAVHGQILTLDNLMLRGRILVNRCCMCYQNEETVDHPPLSYSSLFVGLYVSDLRDSMGHARLREKLGVLLELLAGKI